MRGQKQEMKSLFSFLVQERVTTDYCVTGFNEDPWRFNDTVGFNQNILKHNTSEYTSLLCQKSGIQTLFNWCLEDKSDDVIDTCAKSKYPKI